MEYQKYFDKALQWARRKGFSEIKANSEKHELDSPASFSQPENDKEFVPDMTALKTGGKSYIEIAIKSDNVRRVVTKWKLLSTIAKMKGGTLFLLAPHGHKAFASRLVKKHDIDAKVVSL